MMNLNLPPEDLNQENVQLYGEYVLRTFAKEIGVDMRGLPLPKFIIDSAEETAYYSIRSNTIGFPTLQDFLDGNSLAGEIGHYFREQSKIRAGNNEGCLESVTGECFEMLTRMQFYHVLELGQRPDFFPGGCPRDGTEEHVAKMGILKRNRKLRSGYRELLANLYVLKSSMHDKYSGSVLEGLQQDISDQEKEILDSIKALYSQRTHILIHRRGYSLAGRVAIDRIDDWQKLYAMSDADARKYLRGLMSNERRESDQA